MNMHILDNINISIFKEQISENLMNNITLLTCSKLANIIAIDYVIRLNSKPIVKNYIADCIRKLRACLGQKVIIDESFSTVLMLFSIAIAAEEIDYRDKSNVLNKEQSQDIVFTILIDIHFNDVDINNKTIIKFILKDLFAGKNRYEVINYIQAEPTLFHETIIYALQKYQKQNEMSSYVSTEINRLLNFTTKLEKKINLFKQASSKIATAICVLAVGAISVVTAGASFSIIVVPSAILAIKYAPRIGEKIGEIILNADNNIVLATKKIDILRTNLRKNHQEFLTQQQLVAQKKQQELKANNREVVALKSLQLDMQQAPVGTAQHQLNIKVTPGQKR